jgi:cardiolipin synthase
VLVLRDAFRIPGLLSLARVPLGVAFAFVWWRPAAAVAVIAAAAVTDVLDGWWARRFHQATPTGAALDPIMDKTFALLVMGTLLVARALDPLEAVLLSTREIVELPLVAYVFVHRDRAPQRSNVPGKVTTVLQFVAIFAVLVGWPHRGLAVGATALAGVIAGGAYWARALKLRSAARADRERAPSPRDARGGSPAGRAT